MKQYFMWLKLNQPKNKAQKELQQFAEKYDNCMIDEKNLLLFKMTLNNEIIHINEKFKHCTDILFCRQEKERYILAESWFAVSDAGIYFSLREIERYETSVLKK